MRWKTAAETNPRNTLLTLRQDVDALLRGLAGKRAVQEHVLSPATDVTQTHDAYLLDADMPGLAKEDIHVNINDGLLIVSAERKKTDGDPWRSERPFGRFERAFRVPEHVDVENIEARYENGVLHLTVPKAERAKTRQIAIQFK